MSTRRSFLKQAGLITPAVMLMPDMLWADKKKHAIGIQLYTLRELIVKDPKGILDKIAAAGYTEIEPFGYNGGKYYGMPVKEFAAYSASLGLKAPSGHYMPQKYLYEDSEAGNAEIKDFIAAAVEMKHEYLIIPWLHPEHRQLDDFKRLAGKLNQAGEWCKKAGLQLGYHNHDFEFKSYDGKTGYDILTTQTDQDLVKFEMDLYWVSFANQDPEQLFNKLKGRVPLWHVKDMDKADRSKQTEVGNGQIDFKAIFKFAAVSGMKHFYVEQENNYIPDPVSSIQSSAKYIKANLV
ncbi:sugar phosphate isomerase/epimerase family protein [Flavihumibacter profundi]|jgi:sugar phosphate isomerase/epimerase|uniref:sugar phosphate isomerase/epimerase family protein n=1 Tax=Flavihumibacter profundi TaxID=2716883 RepID=UPI001CC3339C|nr:sugar phosphate isomerase/epimerase [Flavihumibacter profundi]MBZ5855667.1 sugar phosphate isomerase/epimerase [Flavihumibacter profundi]